MKKLASLARAFREEESGAAMIEYSILIGIIAVSSIAVVVLIGGWVSQQFSGLCANLNEHGTDALGAANGGTCDPSAVAG
jgi:pilus assembly protein Flp/PilA